MPLGRFPDLVDRSVVVTGGATGIGAAIVRALHASGARVAFLDRQDRAGTALAGALGAGSLFLACDLVDLPAMRRALDRAAEAHGPASVLVNNAAVDQRHRFDTLDADTFDWMMHVNLRHVVFASQHVLPAMQAARAGSIINVSSGAWLRGLADLALYSAAKAAIVGFGNSLARDAGRFGIRVNAVSPGAVFTERQRELWITPEAEAAIVANQCLPEPMQADDLAELVLFLASDASRRITKQFIAVNGGAA